MLPARGIHIIIIKYYSFCRKIMIKAAANEQHTIIYNGTTMGVRNRGGRRFGKVVWQERSTIPE